MPLRNLVRHTAGRTSRTVRLAAGGTALVAVLGGTAAFTALDKDVTVDADGHRTQASAFGGTVADLLEDQGIRVGEHDIVSPAVGTELADGQTIVVRYGRRLTLTVDGETQTYWTTAQTVDAALSDLDVRADGAKLSASRSEPLGRQGLALDVTTPKDVTVVADGQTRPVTTTATDVAALLAETGVTVRDGDEVSAPLTDRVTAGLGVTVVRVDRSTSTETVGLPHSRRTEETDALFEGEQKVVTAGVDGSKTVTYADVFRDGVRSQHDVTGEVVDVAPVEEVVQVGTKASQARRRAEGRRVLRRQRPRRRRRAELGRARRVRVRRQPLDRLQQRQVPRAVPVQRLHLAGRRGQRAAQPGLRRGADPPRPDPLPALRCRTMARVRQEALSSLLSARDVRELADRLSVRPTKTLGQNFVVDANTVRRIVRVADLGPDDVVVEVGPGLGSLTLALLEVVDRVVAVEIDPVLAAELPATVAARGRAGASFEVVLADALQLTSCPARRRPRSSPTCPTTSPSPSC